MEVKQSEPGDQPAARPSKVRGWWVIALALLALAQVLWAGYQWGVGNQSIQIPFLKKCIDPALYPHDVMVNESMPVYPTWFFRALGRVLPLTAVPTAYLWLHILTAFAVMVALYLLARAFSGNDWIGLVLILLYWAGHLRSLTGEELYLRAFTHTWAIFPLAIAVLVLFYRDRHLAAWALAGVLFNFHALTSLYLLVLLAFGLISARRELTWRKLPWLPAFFLVAAAPTLLPLLANLQSFGTVWIGLTRIRSAGHTFLASDWQTGNPDIPRFALLVGSGMLALSYHLADAQRRKTWWLLAGAAVLFLAGFAGSQLWPMPIVLRAQLFRSSRLVLVLALAAVAHGLVAAWRMPFAKFPGRPRWQGWIEFIQATALALCVAVPPLLPMLPVAFAAATLVALINGRLSPLQALLAGLVLVVCGAAHQAVHFSWAGLVPVGGLVNRLALYALVFGLLVWWATRSGRKTGTRWIAAGAGLAGTVVLGVVVGTTQTAASNAADSWVDVQRWVRNHTPVDALILTPIQPGGFRIDSERSVVGEWRDGTQLFFSAGFADPWWSRMTALQPGLVADRERGRLLSPGKPLGTLDDPAILDLCRRFDATYVVLPASRRGNLVKVYRNQDWAVCRPAERELRATTGPDAPAQRAEFFRNVVLPNIQKYRESEVTLQVVDTRGRPLHGAGFVARETRQRFHFSCSLPFFIEPKGPSGGDFEPPPVTETELTRFQQIFNFSLIPYSAKWLYTEPEEGHREFADLDKYVAWCQEHDVGMELHFVSGYPPPWLKHLSAAQKGERFLQHARDLIERYGSKIEYWQVVNEQQLLQQSPPVFQEIRKLAPQAKLGISDCARFYSTEPPAQRDRDMYRGLDAVRWLKTQGVRLDFFGFHGHRPFRAWPDAREMYEALDAFAREGVKLHITEFVAPLGGKITGDGPTGTWTPEMQAKYYEWYFTVCFSHPSVELINLWGIGPANWQTGGGLLDDHYEPKPAFYALQRLIRQRWHTEQHGTLGLDGSATFRGFHGDYELSIPLGSNRTARTSFAIDSGARNHYRFRLDRQAGTLTRE